jgi:hypothetical protein
MSADRFKLLVKENMLAAVLDGDWKPRKGYTRSEQEVKTRYVKCPMVVRFDCSCRNRCKENIKRARVPIRGSQKAKRYSKCKRERGLRPRIRL